MYKANKLKFEQNQEYKAELLSSNGMITGHSGDMGFWSGWNAILLTRIREELRPDGERDVALLETVTRKMAQHEAAARQSPDKKCTVS